jgi:NADPH:quinone reductase-like Zn-dependent oxidoreductase
VKALAIRRYKAPMEIMELPRPVPGPGDLLVRVRAAGINPIDYKIRDGAVKVLLPFSFPLILGTDLAGDVEAIGPGVTRFMVGSIRVSTTTGSAPSPSMPWYARARPRGSPRALTTRRQRLFRSWG